MIHHKTMKGYSLVEMIVAVGLFSIVMLLATAAYATLVDLDRQSRASSDLVHNLSFALESMARSIRTGSRYACGETPGTNCQTGGSCFSFTDEQERDLSYLLKPDGSIGRVLMGDGHGNYLRSCTPANAISLTDPNVTIDSLVFYLSGAARGDAIQPHVVFTVSGSINVKRNGVITPTRFSVETEATERLLDI